MSPILQAELDAALHAILEEMSAATEQLITILDEEREALNCADADALNRTGEAKQMLMRHLEQLDAERLHMSAVSTQPRHIQPAWRDLLKALTACRDKNQRNGALVSQRLLQVRRALSVLTGSDHTAGTYGNHGELRGNQRSVPLARA